MCTNDMYMHMYICNYLDAIYIYLYVQSSGYLCIRTDLCLSLCVCVGACGCLMADFHLFVYFCSRLYIRKECEYRFNKK